MSEDKQSEGNQRKRTGSGKPEGAKTQPGSTASKEQPGSTASKEQPGSTASKEQARALKGATSKPSGEEKPRTEARKPRSEAQTAKSETPAPSRASVSTAAASTPQHPPGARERHQGRGLALLALLVAVIAFGSTGYLWHQFDQAQTRDANDARLESVLEKGEQTAGAVAALEQTLEQQASEREQAFQGLVEQLTAMRQEVEAAQQANEEALVTRVENLQLAQRGLNESVETIREAVASGGDSNAWTLSEVDYLMQIADHKLHYQKDPDGALDALMVARQRLGAINELAFNPVLLLLDEEIATLRGVERIDPTAMASQIAALAEEVASLPVRNDMRTEAIKAKAAAERENLKAGAAEEADSGDDWIDSVAEKAWGEVKNLVVVRHERRSAPPLIAPEEGYFLAENLRLKLEAARLALLLEDGATYQESLALALSWIDSYFEPVDERVIAAKKEIKALQQQELHPYLPDISKARRAFQDVMEHRQPLRPLAIDGEPGNTSTSNAGGQG